ncbi:MAG: glycosyltransferase [Acidobacteriota bacterium]|jgi:glycosyltransferase involved in cell wall biosynthesis
MTDNLYEPEQGRHPAVSIVIPARNEGRRIVQCLQALSRQSLDRGQYEVIVVDDGSDDDTADVAIRNGARVIRQQNKGPAAARNRGIEEARGEIVLFTDADCIPDEHWAGRLSKPLFQPTIQGTVGRILSRQSNWIAGWVQLELEERYSRMGQQERIDFLNTGNCGFKRAVLSQSRFDESLRWAEDLELSFRLAQAGNRMVFVQDALVEHAHPENLSSYMLRKFRYASCAPRIYRRHPNKLLSDSRTPANLRWQLLLIGLSLAWLPATLLSYKALLFSLGCFAGWLALTFPICRRAAGKSTALGMAAPFFVLMGNLAFLAGTAWGVAAKPGFSFRGVDSGRRM